MAKRVFSFESEDRVESPERLNEYIRVADPGMWVMVTALALVLVAFTVWGFTGRIPETLALKCVVDPYRNCHMDVPVDASLYSGQSLVGKEVAFTLPRGVSGRGKVIESSLTPMSRKEMIEVLQDDFLVNMLVTADYAYILDVEPDIDLSEHQMEVGEVTVIMDEVAPIVFLMR